MEQTTISIESRMGNLALMIAAAMAITVAACAGGTRTDPTATLVPGDTEQTWTVISESIHAAFATPDLAPGERRVAFVLSDDHGLIKLPVVAVKSYFYPDGFEGRRIGPVEESIARFYLFPLGTRGIDTAYLSFDQPGDWSVVASVPGPAGSAEPVEIRFTVRTKTQSVDIGVIPPSSDTRTLADVPSISDLTTGSLHDPALYQISLKDALASGRPTIVAFASPAFCTNAICGPQDEVMSDLNTLYGDKANFIHIDLYENPQEIAGDLSRGILSPVLSDWGLVSQEWTFVLDKDGRVAARFENFAPREELEPAIQNVLGS